MDILADPERVLKGLFFQDLEMQRKYKAYPEMISVNSTYKLLEIRMPVYLVLNEDAMGENSRESEIVAVCFLAEENAEGVGFLLIHLKTQSKFQYCSSCLDMWNVSARYWRDRLNWMWFVSWMVPQQIKLPKMKYWFCRTCYIVKDWFFVMHAYFIHWL